jgi:hypothetical protein
MQDGSLRNIALRPDVRLLIHGNSTTRDLRGIANHPAPVPAAQHLPPEDALLTQLRPVVSRLIRFERLSAADRGDAAQPFARPRGAGDESPR